MKIQSLLSIAMIGLSTAADSAALDKYSMPCAGYAAFETAHQMLHLEGISHAEASERINKSSKKVRDYADRAFERCVAAKANLPFHHYCHEDETDENYKCKKHNPWKY